MPGTHARTTLKGVIAQQSHSRNSEIASWVVEAGRKAVSLLDAEPDLGAALPAEEFDVAARALTAPVEVVGRGDWSPPRAAAPGAVGILILSGLMVRELRLGACTRYAELLGPGDLLRPWQEENEGGMLPWKSSFRALEECTVAGLGPGVARAAARWPEIGASLTSRAMERTRRQGVAAAIPTLVRIQDRMVVLFAHLAERWGHVTPDGITLRLPLTHELIACLAGGRRPTVTTALSALRARGVVTRPRPNEWVLGNGIYEDLELVCSGKIPQFSERSHA